MKSREHICNYNDYIFYDKFVIIRVKPSQQNAVLEANIMGSMFTYTCRITKAICSDEVY